MTMLNGSEPAKRWWDIDSGIVKTLLAIAGLLVGIWQFNAGEINKTKQEYKSLRDKDRIEFRRSLWRERLEAYRATADEVGKISATSNQHENFDAFDAEVKGFEGAYWGRMILVEDPKVAGAMQEFRDATHDFRTGFINADDLKRKANRLIVALKTSVDTDSVAIDLKTSEQGNP